MPNTRAALINKAISLLQEAGAGQSIAAEDYKTFDAVVDPLVAELRSMRIVDIGNVDDIDDEVFLPLARILMNEAGEDFGRPTNPEFRLAEEVRLRRIRAGMPLNTVQRTDYF